MLGRLDETDRRVAEERHRAAQETRRRHEVGVEHGDVVRRIAETRERLQRVVDVAGLRVSVVRPGHVAAPQPRAEDPEPVPTAVVQHPDAQVGVVQRQRACDRPLEDRAFLVVGADQDVDQRRLGQASKPACVGVGVARAVPGPGEEEPGQPGRGHPGGLGPQEHERDRELKIECRGRHGFGHAPDGVARHQGGADEKDQRATDRRRLRPKSRHDEVGRQGDHRGRHRRDDRIVCQEPHHRRRPASWMDESSVPMHGRIQLYPEER